MARPLVVTAVDSVRDALQRLVAVAGAEADVVTDVGAARRFWQDATLVLVGADLARDVASLSLPRRAGVVLVGDDLDDAAVWQRAVELGAEKVAFLPDAEPWLLQRLGAADDSRRAAVTVGVMGGRGGVGASTLAAALAMCAGRLGHAAVLVDADPLGGGLDLLLGAEEVPGARWPVVAAAADRLPGVGLAALLPVVQRMPVLSWDRGEEVHLRPGVLTTVLGVACEDVDVVVVDLSRRLDEVAVEALASVDVLLLAVPADVRGVAAAARTAAAVAPYVRDVRVVVRRPRSGGITPDLVAEAVGLPLAGQCRSERAVSADGDRGVPPAAGGRGHLARLCSALVADLLPVGPALRRSAA